MPIGAWLLIGVGSALVIITVLVVFIFPVVRRPPRVRRQRLAMPRLQLPPASPVGSLLKGFGYLYAPLSYPHIRYSVGGRLQHAIARVDAVDPSVVPDRVGLALQQMVDLASSAEESPLRPEGAEPGADLFDQPRNEEQL
ncbi:MAG TPA: hypothetical protein VFW54_07335 [Propionibacteriaceae bacterium]|nr:hypothetical protein [Propionibacteriaceae bacterium]